MKRLFLTIALLLIPLAVDARMTTVVVGGGAASAACTNTFGAEKNTTTTCTANADASEADATTGWTDSVTGTFGTGATAQLGSYALRAVAAGNAELVAYALTGLSLSAGSIYRIQFYVKHNDDGGDWQYGVGDTTANRSSPYFGTIATADNDYSQKTHYFIYNTRQDNLVFGENSASNDGEINIDNLSIKEVTNFCLGSELYTGNAAAASEENDADGWTGTSANITSSSEQAAAGTYSLKFEATGSGGSASIDLSSILTEGNTYFIRFKTWHASTGDTAIIGQNSLSTGAGNNGGLVGVSATDPGETWKEYGWSFVYGANYRYLKIVESGTSDNAVIYVDSISIKQIL